MLSYKELHCLPMLACPRATATSVHVRVSPPNTSASRRKNAPTLSGPTFNTCAHKRIPLRATCLHDMGSREPFVTTTVHCIRKYLKNSYKTKNASENAAAEHLAPCHLATRGRVTRRPSRYSLCPASGSLSVRHQPEQ